MIQTDAASWWVASEQAVPVRSSAIGVVKTAEDATQRFAPMGRRHAAQTHSDATACGRSLTRLHQFPALSWADDQLASRTCPACLAVLKRRW
jgi:IS4 transposase